MSTDRLRTLPSVNLLLQNSRLRNFVQSEGLPPDLILELTRQVLENIRQELKAGQTSLDVSPEKLVDLILNEARQTLQSSLQPLINATGVLLHTNLGRALLSDEASQAVAKVSQNYNNLEYNLSDGERGSRLSHIDELLARLSGAEAGIAVNNNAAALFLILSAFAQNREVILSRSQAIEIGGSFRIPDVMKQSGAKLVEVGTTNKTYAHDYSDAVTPQTSMLMRVHSSNFKIIGFVHTPSLAEMAMVAKQHKLILADDLGSGTFLDTAAYGLTHEPTIQESVQAGADLVTFSGDKLLGGPQAGLIVGSKLLINQLKKHPLARALRLDKMSIAALQATLQHYLRSEAERKIPLWQMMSRSPESLQNQVQGWQQKLAAVWPNAAIVTGLSTIGGGSLPGETLPTWLLALPADQASANELTKRLRQNKPPIICRIERETLLFDPRTVRPHQEEILLQSLLACGQNA